MIHNYLKYILSDINVKIESKCYFVHVVYINVWAQDTVYILAPNFMSKNKAL